MFFNRQIIYILTNIALCIIILLQYSMELVIMTTVYKNADFISFNDGNDIYSVMVVEGKKIVYVGFNTPICYDDPRVKVVDLEGKTVIPLVNNNILFDVHDAKCQRLAEGESADFAVLDKNIFKYEDAKVIATYVKGKQKV